MKELKAWMYKNYKVLVISMFLIVVSFLIPNTIPFSLLLKFFLAYFGLFIFSSLLPNNKYFKVLKLIIRFPYLLMILISPIHIVTMSFLFTIVFSFGIPAMIIFLLEQATNIEFTRNTINYLGITTGSIIFLIFGNGLIRKNIEIIESGKPKSRVDNQIELTLQVVNQKTYRVFIFSLFLILLLISSISEFQNLMEYQTSGWTRPILQSFVTIVAFDRVIQSSSQIQMSLREMKNKLKGIYKTY